MNVSAWELCCWLMSCESTWIFQLLAFHFCLSETPLETSKQFATSVGLQLLALKQFWICYSLESLALMLQYIFRCRPVGSIRYMFVTRSSGFKISLRSRPTHPLSCGTTLTHFGGKGVLNEPNGTMACLKYVSFTRWCVHLFWHYDCHGTWFSQQDLCGAGRMLQRGTVRGIPPPAMQKGARTDWVSDVTLSCTFADVSFHFSLQSWPHVSLLAVLSLRRVVCWRLAMVSRKFPLCWSPLTFPILCVA